VSPLRDETEEVVRWFGVNSEIGAQVDAEAERDLSHAAYDVLTNAMPQMVWSTRPDGFHDFYNDQWYEFTGVPYGSTDGEAWNGMFHPDDQERAWARWRHSLETGEPYEIEYRLRHRDGEYRWTLGRALPVRDAHGTIQRWIGTCTDIHAAKVDAERSDILSRELSHRIKNIFAIIAGLIGLSARHEPASKPFAKEIGERIAALGRAHEFALPHSELSRPSLGDMTLTGLLQALFAPYATEATPRITISGEDTAIDDRGATPLALLFHELATNAAKYGALSVPQGEVTVDLRIADGMLEVLWQERGGPPIHSAPAHQGFGTRLVAMSVEQQLGGTLERRWETSGLVVRATVPVGSLSRS
jgi:PAS domain S-box-containing protein